MVVLRLSRAGKKKNPIYNVVATDSRKSRDGECLEIIGAYDPSASPQRIEFKSERLEYWLSNGALPSETVGGLMKRWNKAPKSTPEAKA